MYSSLKELYSKIRICQKCKSMNRGQTRVTGVGTTYASIFFIGEAPGRLGADQTGVPFTRDKSGKLLRQLMATIKISTQNDAYISNIVKCNPRDEHGRNRRPSREEIANCQEYLQSELELVKAEIVVPLGTLASWELLGFRRPMKELNGREFYHEHYGRIFPLYHPGYILRGNYSINRYRKDFYRLKKLAFSQK